MKTGSLFIPVLLLLQSAVLFGQLDTIHWLPPMHARNEWGPQYLYLSTPEEQAFPVSIRDGAGTLLKSVYISNSQPYQYTELGDSNNTKILVPERDLQIPLQGRGLVMDGPKKFYAYFRAHSNSGFHAGDLTCKGRAALGKTFRIGHLLQAVDDDNRRSNFIGVMATEDSTLVTLRDFDPLTDLRVGGLDVQPSGPVSILLQHGESAVFSQYINGNEAIQPPNGLMGSLLTSSKPIAVNTGSWVGAPVVFMAHDIGIDQIAPLEQMGKEYILCKGNGSEILERPIVVAHFDNTKIWLNGNSYPAITLSAGEFLAIQTGSFSSSGNLYIRSSEPVFVYQMIGGTANGDDAMRTAGLIFVPPISCGIPNRVDNIYKPNTIGNMTFEGGLMITAMSDSLVTVRIDGLPVPLGIAAGVPGNPDFVTYRNLNLFSQSSNPSTISVVAEGAVQVAMFGRNQPASFAAFYSGFSKTLVPKIQLSMVGDGVCPDTIVAHGIFSGVQWEYEDSLLQFGHDTFLIAYVPGRYTATGYLGVCRRTDYASDSLVATFHSPQFPYALREPNCFGFSDGQIAFGNPYGGFPPYKFSIDEGTHFSGQNTFDHLVTGHYKLVVRDSTGCYNRPLNVYLHQPDSTLVDLMLRRPNGTLQSGQEAVLQALPGGPVVSASWTPLDSSGCSDCLFYSFYPEENTWVSVTVLDSAGCPAVDSLLVLVEPNLYAPNIIKPESSTGNDRFTLFSRTALPIRRLAVFDRWGEKVFLKEAFFTNNPDDGWDGMFHDKIALPGVYVFVAEVETQEGKVVIVKGDVTLMR